MAGFWRQFPSTSIASHITSSNPANAWLYLRDWIFNEHSLEHNVLQQIYSPISSLLLRASPLVAREDAAGHCYPALLSTVVPPAESTFCCLPTFIFFIYLHWR